MSALRLAQQPGSVRAISLQQPHDDRACPHGVRATSANAVTSLPRPQPVRDHVPSLSVSAHSPRPRPGRKHVFVQSMFAHNPNPKSFRRQFRVATYRRPRDFRQASALAPLDADMHSFVPTQSCWSRSTLGRLGARIQIRLYVAGRRVNVLLALLPSALHIAPAARLQSVAFRISRGENCWRQD